MAIAAMHLKTLTFHDIDVRKETRRKPCTCSRNELNFRFYRIEITKDTSGDLRAEHSQIEENPMISASIALP